MDQWNTTCFQHQLQTVHEAAQLLIMIPIPENLILSALIFTIYWKNQFAIDREIRLV